MRAILIKLIGFYQRFISPLFPPVCRFRPTCSQYAIQALEKYGIFKGLFLSVLRVFRCHPYCNGGFDPVP
ncbi:MAG: membrane protein insertion efficiency factor YidD [Candidatus Cloacimonetes bacterium 4572_55]|nr:MAG: membrane protein insertion efficiency factor YidD [Candidatus Cloacimonetes bacterium 4572_55]